MLIGADTTPVAEYRFACSLCQQPAGDAKLYKTAHGAVIVRKSFTSRLEGRVELAEFEPLRSAISSGDAKALFEIDLEYAPFYCPQCASCFCGAHWRKWDVFEENGWHDSIRGACPHGHERLLED
jgi:hypothetical protein